MDATGQKFVNYVHEVDVSGSLIVTRQLLDWNSERFVIESEETVAHYSAEEFLSVEIMKIPDSAEELRFFGVPSEDINRLFMAVKPFVRENETLNFCAKVVSSGKKVILIFTSERIFTLDAKSFTKYAELFDIERITSVKSGSFKSIELAVSGKFLSYVFACPDKVVVSELSAAIQYWIPEQIIEPAADLGEVKEGLTAPDSQAEGEVSAESSADFEDLESEDSSSINGGTTSLDAASSGNLVSHSDCAELTSLNALNSSSNKERFLKRVFARVAVILFGARKAKRIVKRLKSEVNDLNAKIEVRESYVTLASHLLSRDALGANYEGDLLDVGNCELIEVRKGARVTIRESSYSSSGGGAGVRIGRVGVGGGSSSGSSTSTTTSYPAPDILQTIDYGKLKITNRKISFVGSKFTKTSKFPNVVDIQVKGSQLLIAPTTGSKVWICEFPNRALLVVAACLMFSAISSRNRTLDSKCDSDFANASDLVRSNASHLLDELTSGFTAHQLLISENITQLDSLNNKYRGRLTGKVLLAQVAISEMKSVEQLEIV